MANRYMYEPFEKRFSRYYEGKPKGQQFRKLTRTEERALLVKIVKRMSKPTEVL